MKSGALVALRLASVSLMKLQCSSDGTDSAHAIKLLAWKTSAQTKTSVIGSGILCQKDHDKRQGNKRSVFTCLLETVAL